MTRTNLRLSSSAFTPVDRYVMTRRVTTDESIQWAIDIGALKPPPPPPPRRPANPPRRRQR
jgi:hypothetical protein